MKTKFRPILTIHRELTKGKAKRMVRHACKRRGVPVVIGKDGYPESPVTPTGIDIWMIRTVLGKYCVYIGHIGAPATSPLIV